jgi:hypothetical protein
LPELARASLPPAASVAEAAPARVARHPNSDPLAADDVVSLRTVLLPGVYAWATTVALPAWSSDVGAARVGALGALVLLLLGPALARRNLVLGRALGVLGFVGLSAGTWGALGSALALANLDLVRGALGAIAWGFFALGWGSLRPRERIPERDPRALPGEPLRPKTALSRATGVAFGVCLFGGLLLPLLAWRVRENGVALLAHAVALAGAIAVINVGSRLVLARYEGGEPRAMPVRNAPPRLFVVLFAAWLALGAGVWLS